MQKLHKACFQYTIAVFDCKIEKLHAAYVFFSIVIIAIQP